jgi:transposase InsO family protein
MSFALIDAKKAEIPIETACAALGVSVSGFYAWQSRPASNRQTDDMMMLAHIRAEFSTSNGTYGSPRMHVELNESGLSIGRHRVARLMSENGLKARQKTRFKKTTDSDHGGPVATNVLDQDFTATAPDQKWGVDISYVWTAEGWLYLAIVLDLFSRKIVGWQLSDRMKRGLAIDALRRAINLRQPPPGLIHHSDRGSQYCSEDYRRLLRDNGFVASMSGRGNCYDNAMVETVFKTIKSELIWRTAFTTRDQASKAIGRYIEGFYNPRRRHSSLGYVSPAAFEATFRTNRNEERMALH